MRAQRFSVILCVSLVAAVSLRYLAHQQEQRAMRPRVAHAASTLTAQQKPRRIYPFSVIPGGAYSAEELALSRRVDRVVAAHYADFEASSAVVRTLPETQFLYVSYRKGDRVYWTTDKRRIPKGEAVLTDGKHLARARCGNRLAATPQYPVLYGPQPAEAGLNTPELPGPVELPQAPLFAAAYDGPEMPLVDSRPRLFGFPREMTGASPFAAFPAPFENFPFMTIANAPIPGIAARTPGSSGGSSGGSGPVTGSGGGPGGGGGPVGGGGGPVGGGTGPGGGVGPVAGIVPEPASLMLLLLGAATCLPARLRVKRRSCRRGNAANG